MDTPLWLDQINSNEWIKLCDYAYAGQLEPFIEERCKENPFKLKLFRHPDEVGESGVIFCGTTQSIKECLQSIPENGKYILITRDNDQSISEELFNIRPKSIKHWFAVNCAVYHSDITAIPVGCNTLGGYNETLKNIAETLPEYINNNKLIYCRCNVPNEMRPPHERHNCINALKNNPFATVLELNIPSDVNFGWIRFHKFVACPSGTGADTLRVWETLALGSTPILTECDELRQFEYLKVCYTKDWNLSIDWLTEQLLLSENKLTSYARMSYWVNQLNEKRKLIA